MMHNPKFNSSFIYSLPIVASDRHRISDLNEIKDSMEEGSVAHSELEDYINHLTFISEDFLSKITNNLRLHGITEEAPAITANMLDTMVMLALDSNKYNCHGWSLGTASEITFNSTKEEFIKRAILFKKQERFQVDTDTTVRTFFSLDESSLVENETAALHDGSIAIYSDKDKTITHTARYLKSISWYNYDNKLYSEWYDKHREGITFDESGNNCTIESYTSKLGLGYLVVHKLEDITPLYGELDGFFDLVVPS